MATGQVRTGRETAAPLCFRPLCSGSRIYARHRRSCRIPGMRPRRPRCPKRSSALRLLPPTSGRNNILSDFTRHPKKERTGLLKGPIRCRVSLSMHGPTAAFKKAAVGFFAQFLHKRLQNPTGCGILKVPHNFIFFSHMATLAFCVSLGFKELVNLLK